MKEIRTILRNNFIYYLFGLFLIFMLKLLYSTADSERLVWLLAPTARWAGMLTGIPFIRETGMGYVNHGLRFVIAPSCCGLQFMVIVIAVLLFSFIHRVRKKVLFSLLVPVFSFLYTVLINGLRITLAILLPLWLPGLTAYDSLLTPARLHTLIGIVVYFSTLLLVCRLAEALIPKKAGSASAQTDTVRSLPSIGQTAAWVLPSLFWYLFILLGLPFLNSAYRKGHTQFTEYTVLIVIGCLAVLFLPVSFVSFFELIRKRLTLLTASDKVLYDQRRKAPYPERKDL